MKKLKGTTIELTGTRAQLSEGSRTAALHQLISRKVHLCKMEDLDEIRENNVIRNKHDVICSSWALDPGASLGGAEFIILFIGLLTSIIGFFSRDAKN